MPLKSAPKKDCLIVDVPVAVLDTGLCVGSEEFGVTVGEATSELVGSADICPPEHATPMIRVTKTLQTEYFLIANYPLEILESREVARKLVDD